VREKFADDEFTEPGGEQGLPVNNVRGERWMAYGGHHYFDDISKPNREIMLKACESGSRDITYAFFDGESHRPYELNTFILKKAGLTKKPKYEYGTYLPSADKNKAHPPMFYESEKENGVCMNGRPGDMTTKSVCQPNEWNAIEVWKAFYNF
jgi:hypothetical protein